MRYFVEAGMGGRGLIFATHDIDGEAKNGPIILPGRGVPLVVRPAAMGVVSGEARLGHELRNAFPIWCERFGLRRAIEIAISVAAQRPDILTDDASSGP